jgi:hypothetical protein
MVRLNLILLALVIEIYHHQMVNDVHDLGLFQHDHDHFDVCLNRKPWNEYEKNEKYVRCFELLSFFVFETMIYDDICNEIKGNVSIVY